MHATQHCNVAVQLQLVGAGGQGVLHKEGALSLCVMRQLCLQETAQGLWVLILFKSALFEEICCEEICCEGTAASLFQNSCVHVDLC